MSDPGIATAVFNAVIGKPVSEIEKLRANLDIALMVKQALDLAYYTAQARDIVQDAQCTHILPPSFHWLASAGPKSGVGFGGEWFNRFSVSLGDDGNCWAMCTDGYRLHAATTTLPVGIYSYWGEHAAQVDTQASDHWLDSVDWDAAHRELPPPVVGAWYNGVSRFEACAWSREAGQIVPYDPKKKILLLRQSHVNEATAGLRKALTLVSISGEPGAGHCTLRTGYRVASIMELPSVGNTFAPN